MSTTTDQKYRPFLPGFLLIPILVCIGGVSWWVLRRANAAAELDRHRSVLVSRGAPVDDQSLTEFRSQNLGHQNSIRWMRVLEQIDSDEFGESCAKIPVVGVPPNETPFVPGQSYPHDAEVREFLAKWRPLLDEIHEITEGTESIWTEIHFDSFNTLLPAIASTRQVARVVSLEYQDAVRRDAREEVFHSLMSGIGVARSLEREPLMVSQMVHCAIRSVALASLQQALELNLLDDIQKRRILEQLQALDDFGAQHRFAIAGERALTHSAFQSSGPVDHLLLLSFFDQAEAIETDDLHRYFVQIKQLEIDIADEFSEASRLRQWETPVTQLMTPAWGTFGAALVRSTMELRIAKLAIGLRLFESREDRWPETLEELTTDDTIDLGPTHAIGPKPFGYRASDESAEIWGFDPQDPGDSTPETPPNSGPATDQVDSQLWHWKLPTNGS